MAKIIAVVDAVPFRHSSMVMMLSLRRAIAINNAPVWMPQPSGPSSGNRASGTLSGTFTTSCSVLTQ
jgi:hypothetical protein